MEISPERMAWVEGILGRVRVAGEAAGVGQGSARRQSIGGASPSIGLNASNTGFKEENLEDMGKAGSTRRVFLKRK